MAGLGRAGAAALDLATMRGAASRAKSQIRGVRSSQGTSVRRKGGPTPGQASVASYSVDPNVTSDGVFSVLGQMGRQMGSNLMKEGGDGWGVAKMIGKHALKGAVGGAAIGGTQEWAQGGSFWTGAKSGAFNGAVGWGAYRTLGKSVGATTRNPFGRNGVAGKAMDMYSGTRDGIRDNMSKAARVLINGQQGAAAARAANGHGR